MRFWILGPMEIEGSSGLGASHTPRAAKLRVVLAALLVRANEVVSVQSLIDELWQDDPPRTATTTLQVYISQLRKLLHAADPEYGRDALLTRQPGYLLRLDPGRLDMTTFEELHERGRDALERGDFAAAADLQRQAIALWRGPLLSDTPHGPLLESTSVRLTEASVSALEQRIRADLHLGRHRDMIAELQSVAAQHPLREEFHGHLMLALFRTGRQAEALQAFARVRRTLVDELAIEPGPRLQRLHQRILSGDPELFTEKEQERVRAAVAVPSPAPTRRRVIAQLPPADPAFTGRAAALAEVERLLREAPAGTCVAVAGKPGVGKTALAVEAAHRVADAFPDGQLFLDLHPEPGRPLSPHEAMARLLRRAGAPGAAPTEPEELRDALRGVLDGRRILLVLDNATSEAQVRPLLPSTGGSAVLITGRRLPAGLGGVRPVVLDVLGPGESRELFEATAGAERTAGEPRAVAEVVELCGHLPLALRIAGAQLGARPHWSAASLAARLRDERSRLAELRVGDLDAHAGLLAAYRECSAAQQRAFRLLALVSAGRFGLWAAAAVLGLGLGEASRVVEGLVDGRLLEASDRDGPHHGRYHFHELLRLLAAERLAEEEPAESVRAAVARMCEAYAQAAEHADGLLTPRPVTIRQPMGPHAPVFGTGVLSGEHPVDWFAHEQAALARTVRKAYEAGLWKLTVRLVDAMTGYLEAHAAWADWETTHTLALDAARRSGDRAAEARMLRSLGDLAWQHRRLGEARECYDEARVAAQEAGDGQEYGRALVGLAEIHLDTGAVAEAAALLEPALAAVAAPAHARGRYDALRALALLALEAEGPEAAERRFTQCLELAGALRDRRLEAYARRALRVLREKAPGRALDIEVRPGVWRLRRPAPLPHSA
jgi:DNA-binding SARP family transcriptional activator